MFWRMKHRILRGIKTNFLQDKKFQFLTQNKWVPPKDRVMARKRKKRGKGRESRKGGQCKGQELADWPFSNFISLTAPLVSLRGCGFGFHEPQRAIERPHF